jgi:signal transduction histidine kinase
MYKILVIDDEEYLRDMVKIALTDRGYQVVEASNGAEGIELARRELPDLILCDVRMERVDGYLTLATLHHEPATATIPFILMTGLADSAGMRHGMELGADDYLPKPFTIEALFAAVDARLKKAQTAKAEAQKSLAALRDSISLMLPHEMRTPLNGIIGFAELLRLSADTTPPAEVVEMADGIYESGKRLQRLVENFLVYVQLEIAAGDAAKAAAMRSKSTREAERVVAGCARACAKAAGREADLDLELAGLTVPVGEDYLGKMVEELMQNAFKFSSAGSRVCVTLAETPAGATLAVHDRGCGLTAEEIARIGAYMQFQRASKEQQGTGLGLIIAKRVAELHGGTLALQSDREHGTTVTARFPRAT